MDVDPTEIVLDEMTGLARRFRVFQEVFREFEQLVVFGVIVYDVFKVIDDFYQGWVSYFEFERLVVGAVSD